MDPTTLTRPAAPWLHAAIGETNTIVDSLRALDAEGILTARVVRGRKAETVPAFFNEVAAAMQFMPDFGENWDALLDCLSDTHWSKVKATVICILDGSLFLSFAPPEQRHRCRDVFEEAARRLNQAGRSFHVIWQESSPAAAELLAIWPHLSPLH